MSSPLHLKDEIFISYAHKDDGILPGHQQGWVSYFDSALRTLLNQKISPSPTIWRDIDLGKNEVLDDTIMERIARMAMMISILSPNYLDSKWCMREVKHFRDVAEKKRIDLQIAGKSRIIKVVKIPLETTLPPIFSGTIGFEFYKEENNSVTEFRLEFGEDPSVKFLLKVNELANEIKTLIQSIKQSSKGTETPAEEKPETTVYLAVSTLDEDYSNIKSDLLERDLKVLPDRPLALGADDLKKQVRADLKRCGLSIHLIGEEYGPTPMGENRSFVELQHELAIERGANDPSFSRLIWMPTPPDADKTRPEQIWRRRFQDTLSASPGDNVELLQQSLENFKTVIQDKLKTVRPSPTLILSTRDAPLVFVICDAMDFDGARRLHDCLYHDWECETTLPSTEPDEIRLHEDFQRKLLVCDALVIFWDGAPESWVRTKLWELQRIRAKRAHRPFLAQAVYICGQKSEEKERFSTRQALVIKEYEDVSCPKLAPLVDQIQQKRKEEAS